jgi:polyisoprenyl-teichoic acid--peptidoglycan teichoic acid transferase
MSSPGATLERPSPDGEGDGGPDDVPPAAPPRAKRRDPLWARLVILFGALLLLGSAGTVVLLKVGEHVATGSVNKVDVPSIGKDANGEQKHVTITGAKNILLLGIDPRDPEQAQVDGIHPDSIIILHINAAHTAAYLVSLPRDTKVQIPAKTGAGTQHGKGTDKINTAFAWGASGLTGNAALAGGLDLLARTIQQDFQISFDAAAIVDFSGFQSLVDYIGGVHMYVDEDVKSIHIGRDSNGKIVYPGMRQSKDLMHVYPISGVTPLEYTVGWHDFAGWQALDYCRQRHVMGNNDGDYGRQRHQQQFLKAVFSKIVDNYLGNPIKLPQIVNKVGETMTVSDGGISLTDWVWAMRGIGTDGLVTMRTNGGKFNSSPDGHYELLTDKSLEMLGAVRSDTVGDWAAENQDYVSNS